ncbi:hypothetical protein HAALTHF_34630n [Vreelandella aquamarina]|nr:hypothetical protein HAALTHF_34630n [Halomonas axialensis]
MAAFTGIAAPAMVSQLMPPLAAMLAIAAVAGLGDTQVAAWGLASRLETLSLMVILAMTMSLPPLAGGAVMARGIGGKFSSLCA